MIDIKNTLFQTVKDKINRIRYQADDNTADFKIIILGIILDDLYDWGKYLELDEEKLNKIKKTRDSLLINNCVFLKNHIQDSNYVNVNTPQNNDTWKRVWDSPHVVKICSTVVPLVPTDCHAKPFTPDPNCSVSLTYFGTGEKIPAGPLGQPVVDFDTLTICEKMNIYINRDTGQMFALDPKTCDWIALKGEFVNTIEWKSILGTPKVFSDIKHQVNTDNSQLNVSLFEATQNPDGSWNYGSQSSDTPVTNELDDLDDVLS